LAKQNYPIETGGDFASKKDVIPLYLRFATIDIFRQKEETNDFK